MCPYISYEDDVTSHLDLVVALTGGVSGVVEGDLAPLVGEGIPDAHALAVLVPGSLRLIGRAPSPPREPWAASQSRQDMT